MTDIKPCPFCGCIECTVEFEGCYVECSECHVFGPSSYDDAEDREGRAREAIRLWNQRQNPLVVPVIPCEFPDCPNPADYEGWYRRRDPFLGTPTGHIVRIAFCESCKSHPHLCANEPKPTKDSQPNVDVPSQQQGNESK